MATTQANHRWFWIAICAVIAWQIEEARAPIYVAECRARCAE